MSEQWRKRTRTAFRFWEQLLKSWDEAQKSNGLYAELITTLRRFETHTDDMFKPLLERGANPVHDASPLDGKSVCYPISFIKDRVVRYRESFKR
ncbi:MAG: hypothetical protein CV089_03280 [Nitrospira sp. WS110]|nr:hypothetical protein [Nitrospira sp. WS110]